MGTAAEPTDPRADELVDRYFEALDNGTDTPLDELCRGVPDLQRVVGRGIARRLRARRVFGLDGPTRAGGRPVGIPGRYAGLIECDGGAMGVLYVAEDVERAVPVAYKVLRPELDWPLFRGQFVREAQLTARLAHPGVVPVYGVVADGCGLPAYAMQYVGGETFDKVIAAADRRADLRRLLDQFLTVCGAVAYAHSLGVLHNDLKGNNIRVTAAGEAFVIDWGLAEERPGPVTAADEAKDVCRLGGLLYEVLTGSSEVDGTVASGGRKPPDSVAPAALLAVARRGVEGGYGSVAELAADVRRWTENRGVTAYRDWWAVRAARWATRRPAVATGLAAVAVLLAVGFVGWDYVQDSRRREEMATREAALNREWRLHNEGMSHLRQAELTLGRPDVFDNPALIAYVQTLAGRAVVNLEEASREFPANDSHRYYLSLSYELLGSILLMTPAPDVTAVAELLAKGRALRETFRDRIESNGRVGLRGFAGVPMPPDARTHPLEPMAALYEVGRYTEALVELERTSPQWAKRAVPPLGAADEMIADRVRLLKETLVYRRDGVLTADFFSLLQFGLLRLAEVEQSKLPWSRRPATDHTKGLRMADFLAGHSGVADPAVYNAACAFALASAEPGIDPAERERRAAQAVAYLDRITTAGYFNDSASGTKRRKELAEDHDLDPIRTRDGFRQILDKVHRTPR